MIWSFACSQTEALFYRIPVKKIPFEIQRMALRNLCMLDAAIRLEDLNVPPGNKLEKLKGNRKGQYSIRINDQWRICFQFLNSEAFEVEITDYH